MIPSDHPNISQLSSTGASSPQNLPPKPEIQETLLFEKTLKEPFEKIEHAEISEKKLTPSEVGGVSTPEDYKKALEEKEGIIWKCIQRIPNSNRVLEEVSTSSSSLLQSCANVFLRIFSITPSVTQKVVEYNQGYLYGFQQINLKEDEINLRLEKAYPAIEVTAFELFQDLSNGEANISSMFEKLGYKSDWALLDGDERCHYFPDKEALLSRWQLLKKEYPELPDLTIASSEGIADDRTFAEALIKHDILLSTGKEFIHDQTIHIIPTLTKIFQTTLSNTYSNSYIEFRKKLSEITENMILRIEDAEKNPESYKLTDEEKKYLNKLYWMVGAYVDICTASQEPSSSYLAEIKASRIHEIWNNPSWNLYWNNRLNDVNCYETIDTIGPKLRALWTKIGGDSITSPPR